MTNNQKISTIILQCIGGRHFGPNEGGKIVGRSKHETKKPSGLQSSSSCLRTVPEIQEDLYN